MNQPCGLVCCFRSGPRALHALRVCACSSRVALSQVTGAFYTFVQPTPADGDPTLVAASADVAALLDLDVKEFGTAEFLRCFAGVEVPRAWRPWAQCYGGHQFGSWAGQLGDGRAISLTEIVNAKGERWELQLKGAGKTPYSRRADGRAVLRSSLREYVASEAMHWLGVPTTRALSLVLTNDGVVRDMFYSGNPKLEPGAIVCRVARSFLRFGTWQLPASRSEDANVALLTDFAIKHHYPHLLGREDARAAWFKEVCERTARLAAAFQAVGFVHGACLVQTVSLLSRTDCCFGQGYSTRTTCPFLVTASTTGLTAGWSSTTLCLHQTRPTLTAGATATPTSRQS